jgi:hypothetical protein
MKVNYMGTYSPETHYKLVYLTKYRKYVKRITDVSQAQWCSPKLPSIFTQNALLWIIYKALWAN